MLLFTLTTGMALWPLHLFLPEQGVWGIGVAAEVAFLALAAALAYVFWDIAMREGCSPRGLLFVPHTVLFDRGELHVSQSVAKR